MPRKNKYGDICNIPNVDLQIELITLPEKRKMLSIDPEINMVQYTIKLKTKHIILHSLEFDTKEKAIKWFETVKTAFVR
jgi:hypothetical protein